MTESKNTKAERRAIEFLQSAILQMKKAGIRVMHSNYENNFVIIVADHNQKEGKIEKCES